MMIMGWMILIPFTQTCVCARAKNLDEIENCVTDVYWNDSQRCDCDSVPVICASGTDNKRKVNCVTGS